MFAHFTGVAVVSFGKRHTGTQKLDILIHTAHIYKKLTHTHSYTHNHTDTQTHTDTDTHIHTYRLTHTHTHTYRHTQTQTRTHIHRHTHTDTHTHTHTDDVLGLPGHICKQWHANLLFWSIYISMFGGRDGSFVVIVI